MLQIDLWKRVLIGLTCAVGLFLALPNLFYTKVEQHNDALAAIELSGGTPELDEQAAQWPYWLPSALVNLGYAQGDAASAVAQASEGASETTDLIRAALKLLAPKE